MRSRLFLTVSLAVVVLVTSKLFAQPQNTPWPVIERMVPPIGMAASPEQVANWTQRLQHLDQSLSSLQSPWKADVAALLKACRYAIEFQEFYQEKDFNKVNRVLELAEKRLGQMHAGKLPWTTGTGLQLRGFQSAVDGSSQPLGLVLPQGWNDAARPLPLYVWLHGRGDKSTDLHFICERLDKVGQIAPDNAVVVHPFGRQCIGYKSAGETDVMEAIDFVCSNYPIDRERIVLMGFSMGGAGVWHLAAHYGERFVAASPGAGFAETARYQNLTKDQYPPPYEQLLWGVYDVPGYTRNLFNLPVIAYSGEIDKQIQAAQVMEEAYRAEGRELAHRIGPGMGHKYHPDTLGEILEDLASYVSQGRVQSPQQIFIQTRHHRYGSQRWLSIDGIAAPYQDTRVTAAVDKDLQWIIETKNVTRLRLQGAAAGGPQGLVQLDGVPCDMSSGTEILVARNQQWKWEIVEAFPEIRKRPGLSGPIDDAFIDPFLVVLPSGRSSEKWIDRWVDAEASNFLNRWRALFRGEARVKRDVEVTDEDMANYHLVVWGTPQTNRLLQRLADSNETRGPIRWTQSTLSVGERRFDVESHIPMAICPNPFSSAKYLVINSGPTFRQAHDRTNSLQNPHLPDWAVLATDTWPDAEKQGRIVATGFFDDQWQVDPALTW